MYRKINGYTGDLPQQWRIMENITENEIEAGFISHCGNSITKCPTLI